MKRVEKGCVCYNSETISTETDPQNTTKKPRSMRQYSTMMPTDDDSNTVLDPADDRRAEMPEKKISETHFRREP